MTSNSKNQTIIAAAVIILGFAAIFGLSNFLEKNRPVLSESYSEQDLALQGSKLKGFSLGFDGLIADWYWMESLQYLGDKIARAKDEGKEVDMENLTPLNPRLLYPLLNNATDLDPHFLTVYSYGAVVLPAIDPDLAIRIAEKGIANNPQEWRLYQHLGYIYWRLGKFDKAAETYEKGSKIPGAAPFMQMMSARVRTEGGSRETAREMYRQMLEQATDDQTRETVTLWLLHIESLDEQDAIRPVLQDFGQKNGRCPASWREIFPQLRNKKTAGGKELLFDAATVSPVDPSKVPYLLSQTDGQCDVAIDTKASKIPKQ